MIAMAWGLVQSLLGLFTKAQDTKQVANTNAANVSVAAFSAETAHFTAVKDVTMAMMSHPVFWIAWGLGVFPVLLYHACIFWVSTFPFWGWVVLKVPVEELSYGQMVVGSVFTLTGGATLVAGLTAAWIKKI